MIRTIVGKELREVLRDRWLVAGLALVPALLVAALAAGWSEARALSIRHRQASREARANWLEQSSSDPHGAAHHGTYLFKPKSPLASFDPGLDPYLGTTIRLEAHEQHRLANRPASDASDPIRFDASTGSRLLLMVLPLAVILLGFSGFSREREGGTLPMLLGLGVPCGRLIAGKAIALLIVVAALTTPGVLALAAAALAGNEGGSALDVAARGGLLAASYAGYLAGWALVSLAVSALARSSRISLIVLIAAWATTVLVVPRLAAGLAQNLHPPPTQEEYERRTDHAIRYGNDGKNSIRKVSESLKKDLLERHGVDRVEDLPMNFEGVSMQAAEEYTNGLHDENGERLGSIFRAQDRVVDLFMIASPYLALGSASMTLAGTDRGHHDHFARAAEDYRRALVKTMNDELARRGGPGEPSRPGREVWGKVDEFRYEPPRFGWAARQAGWPLLLVAGWLAFAVILSIGAAPSIRRVG